MFGLITTRRHQQETDALRAQVSGLRAERDAALEERNAFKSAAKAAAQQFTAVDDRLRLVDGSRAGQPVRPTGELLRARDHARALEQRLATLQAVNEQCTCGGAA